MAAEVPGKVGRKGKMGGIYTLFGLQQSRAPAPRSNFAFFLKTSSRSCAIPNAAGSMAGALGKKETSVSLFSTQTFRFVLFCSVAFCFAPFGFVLFCSELGRKQQKTKMFYSVSFRRKTAFCFVFSTTPETEDKNAIKEKIEVLLYTHKR